MIEKIIDGIKEKFNIDLRNEYTGYYSDNQIIFLDKQDFEYEILGYIYDEFNIDSEFYYDIDDGISVRIELLL